MRRTQSRDLADVDARLGLLRGSYTEVLDATKHQDDKIGRLFTGVSFLTAAALATGNLGAPNRYLSQRYTEFSTPVGLPPIGILTLTVYLVLIIVCVMLLINSLATPLRIPGGDRAPSRVDFTHAGDPKIKTSQIYFFQIAKYSVEEWSRKWKKATPLELKQELADSLINENHNLAVRTQFKYGRTSEAISVFNLALLFLSLTVVFGATAAGFDGKSVVALPESARVFVSVMFGLYLLFHLQAYTRYTRQTVDELRRENNIDAWLRYGLAVTAAVWIGFLALGVDWVASAWILMGAMLVSSALLLIGTHRAIRSARPEVSAARERSRRVKGWAGSCGAVVLGLGLTLFVLFAASYEASFAAATSATLIWAIYSFLSPSLTLRRNRLLFDQREDAAAPSDPGSPPRGSRRRRAT